MGKYADQVSEAILDQFRRRREALRAILKAHISEGRFLFGSQGNADGGLVGGTRSIDEWIDNLSEASLSARMSLTRDEALGLSETELRDRIAGDFRELFPLVLIATHDDPVTAIESLAGSDEELELQPEYTLKECAADTGFDLETLSMWRDAIERKGQAVCSTATPPPMTSSPRCGVGRISSGPACGLAEAGSGIQIMDERARKRHNSRGHCQLGLLLAELPHARLPSPSGSSSRGSETSLISRLSMVPTGLNPYN